MATQIEKPEVGGTYWTVNGCRWGVRYLVQCTRRDWTAADVPWPKAEVAG